MLIPARIDCRHRHFTARLTFAFAALVLFAFVLPLHAQDDSYVVRTKAGLVRGVARSNGGARFAGIPYAEPPVGPLRWRAPVPKKTWSGIRDASTFGASCAQPILSGAWNRFDAENGQEDCLYLNVTTPVWPVAKPLPVMFWMHGGANEGGSGSGALYNNGTLTARGILLVTINYRLGVFGFLALPALTRESPHRASGNYGLMDQILALHWVRDNIARFGGDPNNITVFGQSAGANDLGMLMTSPLARGLFQKAIAESGSPFFPTLPPLADAERQGEKIAVALNAPAGAAGVDAMRQIPARDLLAKLGSLPSQWPNGIRPDVDGWVIPRLPLEVFVSGQQAAIPLLLGVTTRELGSPESPDVLRTQITNAAGDLAPGVLALYGLAGDGQGTTDPLYGSVAVQWSADSMYHCPADAEALWQTAAHQPAYEYEFDYAIPGQDSAIHSAELPYVFGYFPKAGNIAGKFTSIDTGLADLVESYWTNFAKTGDPNSPGLPPWPEFDAAERYLIFAQDGHAVVSNGPLRGPQCELLRKVLGRHINHP